MKTLLSLLTMSAVLLLTAKAFPVVPIHPDGSSTDTSQTTTAPSQTTTAPNPEQNISLSNYTAMVQRLVGAMQTIWIIFKEHVRKLYNYGQASLIRQSVWAKPCVRLRIIKVISYKK